MMAEKFRSDLGHASLAPNAPVVAGSCGIWKIIYTVGAAGISRGGKISFGIPHGFSIPQTDNPYHPGYCRAVCRNKKVSLVHRCTRSTSNNLDYEFGDYGSISTGVMAQICEEKLAEGDQVIFTYGNKQGHGSFARSIEGPAVFDMLICPENALAKEARFYFLKNTPVLQVIARKPEKVYVTLPSAAVKNERIALHITAKDEFDNTCSPDNMRFSLRGKGALSHIRKDVTLRDKIKRELISVGQTGIGKLDLRAKNLSLETNPIEIKDKKDVNDYKLYWGDPHSHSFASDGLNEPEELYEYAAQIDRADFVAVTDHDNISDAGWEKCINAVKKYNKNGKFVAFLGYEFSSGSGIDRNVYFRGDTGELIRSTVGAKVLQNKLMGYANGENYKSIYKTVASIRELLKKLNRKNAMVIPHIHRMDWENHNPIFESVAEIYSNWGSREYAGCKHAYISGMRDYETLQYALKSGYKLGFVAGSDGHAGRPGKDYWLRVRGAGPGGITAIYARELTRESLWEALKARRCYATTGKRIIVKFHLNGHMMGSEVKLDDKNQKRLLKIEIYGTDKLSKITIVKNNLEIYTKSVNNDMFLLEYEDKNTANNGDYYYLRIEQQDGAMAWSSPVWTRVDKKGE